MSLKEYARIPEKRKAYVQQPGRLLVGVDVSQAKHSACIGTQTGITCRKLEFTHSREGFQRFEQTLRDGLVKNSCRRLLIAMAPSGVVVKEKRTQNEAARAIFSYAWGLSSRETKAYATGGKTAR